MASNQPDNNPAGSAESQQSAPLPEATLEVFRSGHRYLAELLDLLTLEVRYSGLMLATVIALALIAALATFSIWALFNSALVIVLIGWGWGWPTALGALTALNVLLLLGALWQLSRALKRIGLDHTRQALGMEAPDVSK